MTLLSIDFLFQTLCWTKCEHNLRGHKKPLAACRMNGNPFHPFLRLESAERGYGETVEVGDNLSKTGGHTFNQFGHRLPGYSEIFRQSVGQCLIIHDVIVCKTLPGVMPDLVDEYNFQQK